jgi:hypothetical protein
MKSLLQHFKSFPFFHWLLPVFFVLHGFTDYYPSIPAKECLLLTGIYLFVALILFGISFLLFKNKFKSALFVFLLLVFYFFFGPAQDALKSWMPGSFITRYSFILPASLIFFIALFILLKRRKQGLLTITFYLNILVIVLLLTELVMLTGKKINNIPSGSLLTKEFKPCTDCKKPDIYLIIADGYAGKEELDSVFHFDNSGFENELTGRGFHLTENSISNYNYTPFSISSMLNMSYLTGIKGRNSSKEDMKTCFNTINKNATLQFLKNGGYDFYNYSIFDFDGQPSLARPTFLPTKTKPLVSQTFLYRMQRDLWFHLVTTFKLSSTRKNSLYLDLKNNTRLYESTKEIASEKSNKPKFVYTHLVMPHYPYYFDSTGTERPFEKITEENATDTSAYISYLKYSSKKLLELTDHIQKSSATPSVIILMGDHGFREFKNKVADKYHFMTLNAVLLPDKNYTGFYKGMSHINQFRTILNSQFKQNLPLHNDSTCFIIE